MWINQGMTIGLYFSLLSSSFFLIPTFLFLIYFPISLIHTPCYRFILFFISYHIPYFFFSRAPYLLVLADPLWFDSFSLSPSHYPNILLSPPLLPLSPTFHSPPHPPPPRLFPFLYRLFLLLPFPYPSPSAVLALCTFPFSPPLVLFPSRSPTHPLYPDTFAIPLLHTLVPFPFTLFHVFHFPLAFPVDFPLLSTPIPSPRPHLFPFPLLYPFPFPLPYPFPLSPSLSLYLTPNPFPFPLPPSNLLPSPSLGGKKRSGNNKLYKAKDN